MSLFEFMKDKGAELLGFKAAAENDQIEAIKAHVAKMGLTVENFEVTLNNTVAKITGQVPTSEDREKLILAVGNIDGVAGVNDELSVTNPAPEAQFYTVQSGDSLSKIAKDFYGDPMKYPDIFEANKPMLNNPEQIYPGQTLRIPTTV